MNKNKINLENIPEEIPIFPLSNAIFFPNTVMPLNIFEPRYKQMIEDAFDKNIFGAPTFYINNKIAQWKDGYNFW